ncbi:hypothetical protein ABPG75_012240, partial [Micractinium tetrahymenae]
TFVVDIAVLSLLDPVERQWLKAAPGIEICGTDGQTAFGSWALSREHAAMLVVEDALQDARFNTNLLVTGPPRLRFFAGAPLIGSEGSVYGMLYTADRQPRHFAAEQLSILGGFAEVCTRKLEAPRLAELQERAAAAEEGLSQSLKRDLGVVEQAVLLCNMETRLPYGALGDPLGQRQVCRTCRHCAAERSQPRCVVALPCRQRLGACAVRVRRRHLLQAVLCRDCHCGQQ